MEKGNALRETIKTLLDDGKERTTASEIRLTLKRIYENLFQKNYRKVYISDIEIFLSDMHFPTTSDKSCTIFEAEITEDNLLVALKSKSNYKSHENVNFMKIFEKI